MSATSSSRGWSTPWAELLRPAPSGPLLDGGRQKHLDVGVGNDDRAHVPALEDHVALGGLLALLLR